MCKRWRDLARLAWKSLKCIGINKISYIRTVITRKHIGHALTRFELNVSEFEDVHLSFTALAQYCPNIEHLDIKQVYSLVNNI